MLNNSFNRMIEQLDELMSTVTNLKLKEANLRLKQKDALIQVLQNQINPHLLYNTLDIIKSIAFLEEVPKIEKMAGNLANIYRYTAKIADAEVTLREELDHVAKYLEIIHIRFMKNFQSSIYVNERFMEAVIMKFTLQPIVENAVKYAVEPNGGSAAVIVSAYLQEDDLMVEIADNGPGFTPDKLEEMNQTFQEITEHVELTVSRDSLGLANVHSRLVLQYGEKWGLHLSSFPERGTVVTVRIPFRKREGS